MTTKHTISPWYISGTPNDPSANEPREIVSRDGTLTGLTIRTLANAWGQYDDARRKEVETLARLAPEMADLLRLFVEQITEPKNAKHTLGALSHGARIAEARAILAKLDGDA